jgi:hypothetical protein
MGLVLNGVGIAGQVEVRFGVGNLDGAAGGSYVDGDVVEDIGRGRAVADYFFGLLEEGAETAGFGGGDLKAVQESVGALGVDKVAGEGVDDLGESELDGERVLERRDGDDVAAVEEILLADHGGAVEAVAFVELAVEVTEDGAGEGYGVALDSVGLDVAAEKSLHVNSPCPPNLLNHLDSCV